jgi:hypothetical protein
MKKRNIIFTLYFIFSASSVFSVAENVQSKTTNYVKQTQFSKKSNVYNRSFDNELQRKMHIGHLVKTNPNKANFLILIVCRVGGQPVFGEEGEIPEINEVVLK